MANGKPLDDHYQNELRAALKREGLRPLARRIGVSTNTISAAAAGVSINGSSRILIQAGCGEADVGVSQ